MATVDDPVEEMLRISEVAALLGLSTRTIHREIARGRLTFRRMGGALRFTRDDVARYVDNSGRLVPSVTTTVKRRRAS